MFVTFKIYVLYARVNPFDDFVFSKCGYYLSFFLFFFCTPLIRRCVRILMYTLSFSPAYQITTNNCSKLYEKN